MQTINAHGAAIPALGSGVFRISDAEVERVVPATLEAGFRHFDTAQIYRNEAAPGRVLQATGARPDGRLVSRPRGSRRRSTSARSISATRSAWPSAAA